MYFLHLLYRKVVKNGYFTVRLTVRVAPPPPPPPTPHFTVSFFLKISFRVCLTLNFDYMSFETHITQENIARIVNEVQVTI